MKFLSETDEPNASESSMLKADPIRRRPLTEQDDPIRAAIRKDRLLPTATESSAESEDPNRETENIDKHPICTKDLTLKLEPIPGNSENFTSARNTLLKALIPEPNRV
jgi:hypothetical protein